MLILNRKKDVCNCKNPISILYSIFEVYELKCRPINDSEMVEILKSEYNINLERRTIKRYRQWVTTDFDISLVHEKKGYYIKQPNSLLSKRNELKINIIKNIINSEDNSLLNVKLNGNNVKILPLKINTINNQPYLLGAIKWGDQIEISVYPLSSFTFSNPLSIKDEDNIFGNILDDNIMFDDNLINTLHRTIKEDDYEYEGKIILKKTSESKIVKIRLITLFSEVKRYRKTIKGVNYIGYSFKGKNSEMVKFCISFRKYLKMIDSPTLLEEVGFYFDS